MTNQINETASGILMLTASDGRVFTIRVSGVDLEIYSETDEVSELSMNGTVVLSYGVTTTSVSLNGSVNGMTIIDPSADSD